MIADRRRVLGAMTALAGFAATPALARFRDGETPDSALDAVLAATTPVALAGAVVTREGLAWTGAKGLRRAGAEAAVTVDDRWHLGSNAKAMTAALYGCLVEQGRARWGANLAELFPDMPLDAAFAATPVERLLQHRAGLRDADVIGLPWLMTARADPRSLPEQRADLAALGLGKAPGGTPGAFAYGNANYIVLGAAIERITGQSWEDAMRQEMFEPLGMASAGFGPPRGDNAWGHRGATPMNPDDPGADNPQALGPAGCVHASLADYAKFLRVFLTDGGGWLKPETVAHLTAPPLDGPPAYALGWGIRPAADGAGGPVLAHEGSNTMWHALAVVAPARGFAVVAVSNETAAGSRAVQTLGPRLMRAHAPG